MMPGSVRFSNIKPPVRSECHFHTSGSGLARGIRRSRLAAFTPDATWEWQAMPVGTHQMDVHSGSPRQGEAADDIMAAAILAVSDHHSEDEAVGDAWA
jgi:hypothetical protein